MTIATRVEPVRIARVLGDGPPAVSRIVEHRKRYGVFGPFLVCYQATEAGAAPGWNGGGYCVLDIRDWTVMQFGRLAEDGRDAALEYAAKQANDLPEGERAAWAFLAKRFGVSHGDTRDTRSSLRRYPDCPCSPGCTAT